MFDDNESESKRTEYLVPANVSAKFEIVPGFGWGELKHVVFSIIVGVLLYFLTGLTSMPGPVRIIILILPIAGTYLVVKRDPTSGLSLVTNLKALKEFKNKQKRYLFKLDSGKGGN